MVLAELEVFHNRPYSPTRRLALGRRVLPVDPPPGFGPLLLGGIMAVAADELDPDDAGALRALMSQIDHGKRIVQPRLRHRFQTDHHGLARTVAQLHGGGESLEFDFVGHGSALQMALAAVYAAAEFPLGARSRAMEVLRKGLVWRGAIGPRLVTFLSGVAGPGAWSATAFADPRQWALERLGLHDDGKANRRVSHREIQRRYRQLLRDAHPDHGGDNDEAAERIAELSEARRILLASDAWSEQVQSARR